MTYPRKGHQQLKKPLRGIFSLLPKFFAKKDIIQDRYE